MKIKIIKILVIIGFLVHFNLQINTNYIKIIEDSSIIQKNSNYIKITLYVPHGPITIINNSDFAFQAQLNGWLGYGNLSHPYKISGYEFNLSTPFSVAINITNTDVYFDIKDNIFRSASSPVGVMGVFLSAVQNANISFNQFELSGENGIYIDSSTDIEISDNYFTNIYTAISLFFSTDIKVLSNSIYGTITSIMLFDISNSIINFNNITSNDSGIVSNFSDYNELSYNFFINNLGTGIFLGTSVGNLIYQNYFDNNWAGIELVDLSSSNEIVENTFLNHQNDGIRIFLDSDYVYISKNNIRSSNVHGIHIWESNYIDIINNDINNNENGIYIENGGDFSKIHRNSFHENFYSLAFYYASNVDVTYNSITLNDQAADIWYSDNIKFDLNDISYNTYMGFNISDCQDIYISNSSFMFNPLAITITNSFNIIVTTNVFQNSSNSAIFVPNGYNNQFFLNDFIDNNVEFGLTQVEVWNRDNLFDNGYQGNYWSDHTNIDNNDDGIADDPYCLDGIVPPACDRYPLIKQYNYLLDLNKPSIISLVGEDYYLTEFEMGHELIWLVSDDNPDYYIILMNGTEVESDSLSNAYIFYSLDELHVNIYEITLVIFDQEGHSANNTILVHVISRIGTVGVSDTDSLTTTRPTIRITTTNSFSLISVIVIIGIVFNKKFQKKRKKN